MLPLSPPGRCRLGIPRLTGGWSPSPSSVIRCHHVMHRPGPASDGSAGGNYHNGPRYQSELIRQVNKDHRLHYVEENTCNIYLLQTITTHFLVWFAIFTHVYKNQYPHKTFFSLWISTELASGLFKNSYKSFSWRVHKLETKLNMVQSLNFEQLQLNHFSNTIPPTLTPFRQKKY